jgi:hypothetical protein
MTALPPLISESREEDGVKTKPDDGARQEADIAACADEMTKRGAFPDKSMYQAAPYTLEQMVAKYPALEAAARSETRSYQISTVPMTTYHECEGVFMAPPDLGGLTAYAIMSDGAEWARHHDDRWFDAILPDGHMVKNFVKGRMTIAETLRQMDVTPVLIVHWTFEGRENYMRPEDGYTEWYRTWIWYLRTDDCPPA